VEEPYFSTSTPILRAVPATDFMADSMESSLVYVP